MGKNELKVCSGSYKDGNAEFTGTYKNVYLNGKYQQYKVGIWNFWYTNGQMKFEDLYKDGTLILKKCWNSKGKSISCDQLELEIISICKNQ